MVKIKRAALSGFDYSIFLMEIFPTALPESLQERVGFFTLKLKFAEESSGFKYFFEVFWKAVDESKSAFFGLACFCLE